ncbi:MAG: glycosyltransferase [Oscillospiraceae bacterium]|jgi:glycosyltransferase involved in cell wall biosynthesis|nr:glycosyltransferase [Oscillospiraceae bacterium]
MISVIIPVYNVEKYLKRCVDSVLAQTYQDFEIILVDDGSTDNGGKLCDEYAALNDRIRTIHQANGGLSAARNTGIDEANGEYISFIDSDDWIAETFLEVLYNTAVNNNADISTVRYYEIWEDGRKEVFTLSPENKVMPGLEAMELVCDNPKYIEHTVCNKLFKKHLFNQLRFKVGIVYEDWRLTYKLLYFSNTVAVNDEILYFYFQRSGSIRKSEFSEKKVSKYYIYVEREEFFKEHNLTDLIEPTIINRMQAALHVAAGLAASSVVSADVKKKYYRLFKDDMHTNRQLMFKGLSFLKKLQIAMFYTSPAFYSCLIKIKMIFKKG